VFVVLLMLLVSYAFCLRFYLLNFDLLLYATLVVIAAIFICEGFCSGVLNHFLRVYVANLLVQTRYILVILNDYGNFL